MLERYLYKKNGSLDHSLATSSYEQIYQILIISLVCSARQCVTFCLLCLEQTDSTMITILLAGTSAIRLSPLAHVKLLTTTLTTDIMLHR